MSCPSDVAAITGNSAIDGWGTAALACSSSSSTSMPPPPEITNPSPVGVKGAARVSGASL